MKGSEYTIATVKNKKGSTSFRIYLGQVDGKRKYRQFSDFKVAQTLLKKLNRELELKRVGYDREFAQMLDRKAEIAYALEESDKMGVSLNDLVKFYQRHGNVTSKPLTIKEAIERFKEVLKREGASKDYIKPLMSNLGNFQRWITEDTLINEITKSDIEKYVFVYRKDAAARTKKNSINNLSVFFNRMIKGKRPRDGHVFLIDNYQC